MEFRLLGPLEVVDDNGAQVALGGLRPRALLALLLLYPNEAVSTDRLIDGIWGESPPASAPNALQVHVHALRNALGGDRIVTRSPGYLVRLEPDELDSHRFERYIDEGRPAEALALWRGPALADLAYQPFAQAEAVRLEDARLGALEARIEDDLEAGRHAALTAELGRSSRCIRTASASAPSRCSRSTGPGARQTRSPPTGTHVPCSTSSGSSRLPSCAASNRGSSARIRASTHPERLQSVARARPPAPRRRSLAASSSSPRWRRSSSDWIPGS